MWILVYFHMASALAFTSVGERYFHELMESSPWEVPYTQAEIEVWDRLQKLINSI